MIKFRRVSFNIRKGRDKRWYVIVRAPNGKIIWVTPRGYKRTFHAEKPIRSLLNAMTNAKFEIITARATYRDLEAIEEARRAVEKGQRAV